MRSATLTVASIILALQPIPTVAPGAKARGELEKRLLARPFWMRRAWAEGNLLAIESAGPKHDPYSRLQWRALYALSYPTASNDPEPYHPLLKTLDGEWERADFIRGRRNATNPRWIAAARRLLARRADDLCLLVMLARSASFSRSGVGVREALSWADRAVALAPHEPLARLARGTVCYNRYLESKIDVRGEVTEAERTNLARRGAEDFEWFLSTYRPSAPKNDPYAQSYVRVVESCARTLRRGSRMGSVERADGRGVEEAHPGLA